MKKIFTLVAAVFVAASAFAQTEISELIKGKTQLELEAGKEYTLNGVAELSAEDVIAIIGNGATIKVGEGGKFSIQKGIALVNVVLDASGASNSALELSANPAASLATYEGETMKYPNATWKGYEAAHIELTGCTYITNNSIFRPAAAWSLRNLVIDNSIIEVKYKTGKAIINMEENGAGVIQIINILNSTIYADDPATEMRFHRYAAQNDPWRVWGHDGVANDTKDYWYIMNNTFVGVCGNKDFSNNMKNTNATEFTFKNNAFVNTWRINKLGTNCKRNFEQADNVIMGGTNAVDGTDGNWFTAVEDLGIKWDFTEGAPAATDIPALAACFKIADAYSGYGDPRWNNIDVYNFNLNAEITADGKPKQTIENQIVTFAMNWAEGKVTVCLPEAELKGWTMKPTVLTIKADGDKELGEIGIYGERPEGSLVFVNPAKENVTATDVSVAGYCDVNGKGYVQVEAKVPGIGEVTVSYTGSVVTGINNIAAPAAQSAKAVKAIQNGRIVIMNGGNTYNVAGQRM